MLGEKQTYCTTCSRCLSSCKAFYCASCIASGQFSHSNSNRPQSFSQIKVQLLLVEREIERDLKPRVQSTSLPDLLQLQESIGLRRQRVQWLQKCVNAKRSRVDHERLQLEKLTSINQKRFSRLPKYVQKVEQIRRCLTQFRKEIKAEEKKIKVLAEDVARERLQSFNVLVKDIFVLDGPLKVRDEDRREDEQREPGLFAEEQQTLASSDEDENSERERALLADAMATSYSEGRWVSASSSISTRDQSGQLHYKVICSLIPASGNYDSCLQQWPSVPEPRSPFEIVSALGHSAHLVGFLSSLFDVVLPQHCALADFSHGVVRDEFSFRGRVAKLNLNIVHLCLSQGIRWELLRPSETVYNLKFLLDFISLGKAKDISDSMSIRHVDYSQLGERLLAPLDQEANLKTVEEQLEEELQGWEKLAGDRVSLASWSSHGSSPPSSQSTVSSLAAAGGSKMNTITSFLKGLARHN